MALAHQTPELTKLSHPERHSERHVHLEFRCSTAEKGAELQFSA
jgi:hypothetical protein